MAHPRQEIRSEVVRLLTLKKGEGWRTDAKARVYDSRDLPLNHKSLPAILLYTVSDEMDPVQLHDGGLRKHLMTLRVECYHTGETGAADVDELSWQVEGVLNEFPTLSGKVESARLSKTDIAFAEEGETALFAAIMDVDVVYYTNIPEEGGTRPRLFVGFDPQTGLGNESEYYEIGGMEYLPDV